MSDKGKFNQVKYQNEYNRQNYDRFSLMLPKGKKELIKEAAKAVGLSMNEYINKIIDEKLNQ